jgi:hypothetical protein
MASAASVTCNSFLQVSAHLALSCSPVHKQTTLEAMACVFYTQPGKYLTLIHINETSFNCVCLSVS